MSTTRIDITLINKTSTEYKERRWQSTSRDLSKYSKLIDELDSG